MRRVNDFLGSDYEFLGEIDNGLILYKKGERMDLADVWPGKRTDLASLERNAAAFKREEHRRFFKLLGGLIAKFTKHAIATVANALRKRQQAKSSLNNFTTILARTHNAALYRDQIPAKDYRDD